MDSVAWEIPAGMIDDGEDILDAAEREVLEETGYQATDARHVYTLNPVNGMANRVYHVASCMAHGEPGAFDGNEIHAVPWRSMAKVKSMIRDR